MAKVATTEGRKCPAFHNHTNGKVQAIKPNELAKNTKTLSRAERVAELVVSENCDFMLHIVI